MQVTKRNGNTEPLNLNKITQMLVWAGEGLDVSISQVELSANLHFEDGMSTRDIHKVLVKTIADLISEDWPDYQTMAARADIFSLRKEVYGQFEPPTLEEHIIECVGLLKYTPVLLNEYTSGELTWLNDQIDHWRDLDFSFAAVTQLRGKYLVQDRTTKQIYETPQFAYMAIGMVLFHAYPAETRLHYVKNFYDYVSTFKLSLPTPIMAGVRTLTLQFSSCVVIDSDDSLDSINAAVSSIVKYISQRAGIGFNIGRLRALGSKIRGGEAYHTGVIPFLKMFQAAVKSCSQGGVRGGAATVAYPIWHLEVMQLLALKNNRGTEETRVRHLDYNVQINKFFYDRLLAGQTITLFSPGDVPDLYEAFFADQEEFKVLYELAEADPSLRKSTVSAIELFGTIASERAQTGRIYISHVDHFNTHSAFREDIAPVVQSNLCMEIGLPTSPLKDVHDADGEIALCTLAAYNLGAVSLDEMDDIADITVRALDALIDYQDYLLPAAEHGKKRRSLGVGVTNFAYWLAKNGLYYSNGMANNMVHQLFERFQYGLLRASNNLAKERGACEYFNETKYSKGLLPIDHYSKSVDSLHKISLQCDWEALRADILKYGLRNSTLTALMPCETSSQITNSTNGIEPPRGLVSTKGSKEGWIRQVVPGIDIYTYELLWDIPDNRGYLEIVAIAQKFVDQSISANTNYDPSKFPGGKVPVQVILQDMLTAHQFGVKALYYHNTRDDAVQPEEDGCAGGACKL
jgi:ribonucleoside-diphosphate reductase alpha chain